MKKILFLLSFVSVFSLAQTTKGDGTYVETTGDEYWSGTINLNGKYVVKSGHTITIAPGTVIKAISGLSVENASAFIVAPGGKVNAAGTAENPIIFTSNSDPLDGTNLQTGGEWGGVIILGNAKIGKTHSPGGLSNGTAAIEGVPAALNMTYGGDNDNDNSGVFSYVSIRYGGTAISANNEINGLTLGGVGSGTTINNIEIIYNEDDGIEFFGGSVDVENLLVWAQSDDAIDVDQAYSGTVSNALVIMANGSDNVFEIDGTEGKTTTGTDDLSRDHTVRNVTAIGTGNSQTKKHQYGHWKSSARGAYSNVYYKGFITGTVFKGLVETTPDNDAANINKTDALDFSNFQVDNGDTASTAARVAEYDANKNLVGYKAIADYGSWLKSVTTQSTGAALGVFDWTFAAQKGAYTTATTNTKGDGTYVETTGDEYWSGTINLNGKYVVKSGHTITIAPGTVIKAISGLSVENASAFIVAPGGKVNAAGTAENPIIFTSNSDPLDGTNLQTGGEWGGVIILGNAKIGKTHSPGGLSNGTAAIEGVPAALNMTYGGDNDNDNSGVFSYVSIRYGGTAISANNEINGLTLGGVGSGTTINNIEIIYNEDDGIEFFGGSVDVENLLVWAQSDDAIDVDQAYSGTVSNALVIMANGSDNVFEIDGTEGKTTTGTDDLSRDHTVRNVTAIGTGNSQTKKHQYGHWKSSARGAYSNVYYKGFITGTVFKGLVETTPDNDAANINKTDALDFSNFQVDNGDTASTAARVAEYDANKNLVGYKAIADYGSWLKSVADITNAGSDNRVFGWTFYASLNSLPFSSTLTIDDVVDDYNRELNIVAYPNPASNKVYIQTNAKILGVNVYNILGKRVRNTVSDTIDVTNLTNGVYIMTIETDLGSETKRLIKK